MIQYAILYNVFCCWMVTVVALSTARHIFVYRSHDPVDRAFAQFRRAFFANRRIFHALNG